MKKIAAARFKEQCLSILDRLGPEGVVITKHGKPVAKVLPYAVSSTDLIGRLQDRIQVHGDITTSGIAWEAGD